MPWYGDNTPSKAQASAEIGGCLIPMIMLGPFGLILLPFLIWKIKDIQERRRPKTMEELRAIHVEYCGEKSAAEFYDKLDSENSS